jgi:hypothetical protein
MIWRLSILTTAGLVLESGMDVAHQHEAPGSECAQILTRWRFRAGKNTSFIIKIHSQPRQERVFILHATVSKKGSDTT